MKLDPFIEAEKDRRSQCPKDTVLCSRSPSPPTTSAATAPPSARQLSDAELLRVRSRAIHTESKGTYGDSAHTTRSSCYRHVAAGKRRTGATGSMRVAGLEGRCKKRWRTTTVANPDF